MQTLQQNWPKLKTYKYRITYADFQPNATKYGAFLIHTFPKAVDIAFIKVWHTVMWAAPSLNTCTLRIHDNLSLPITDNAQGQYCNWNGLVNPTSYTGLFNWAPNRIITTANPNPSIISSMTAPTSIYATLNLNNPRIIDQLTAGSFDIWIGTLRNT